jgi:hypothetical protein
MTQEFDFSTFDIKTMLFQCGNLTPAQAEEKRQLWEQYQAEKATVVANKQLPTPVEPKLALTETETKIEAPKRPVFIPKAKPPQTVVEPQVVGTETELSGSVSKPEAVPAPPKRPIFRPTMKPKG